MDEPGPASSADQVVEHLKSRRDEANIAGMGRYGIATDAALGISNTELRVLARL